MAESSLKEKLLGIIFEPETDADAKTRNPSETPRLKAEDLLYDKNKDKKPEVKENASGNRGTFINYTEAPQERREPEQNYGDYVSSQNISPIFGPLDNESRSKKSESVNVDYASIEKPSSSHLGMVMSPIYGYDTKKANDERSRLQSGPEKEETIVDFDITEDLGDIFEGDDYKQEAPEDKETYTEEIDLFSDFYISEDK